METLPITLLKELTDFRIDSSVPLKNNVANFYKILRKYGIKQGIKNENGTISMNNLEYTLCINYFEQALHFWLRFQVAMDLGNFLPKDLEV